MAEAETVLEEKPEEKIKEEKKVVEKVEEKKVVEKPELKEEKQEKEEKPVEEKKADTKSKVPQKLDLSVKVKHLRTVVDALKVLGTEALLQVRPDGFKIEMVDPAHVCMACIDLNSKACNSYKANTLELGVDLDKLDSLLRLASMDSDIHITYDGEVDNCLYIEFEYINRRLGCIDVHGIVKPKVPNIMATAEVDIDAGHIIKALKATEMIADYFEILAEKDKLVIGNEMDSEKVDATFNKDIELHSIDVKNGSSKSLYSIDIIKACFKVAHGDTLVKLRFGNDLPMIMNYGFEDGALALQFLTAPRIESE